MEKKLDGALEKFNEEWISKYLGKSSYKSP